MADKTSTTIQGDINERDPLEVSMADKTSTTVVSTTIQGEKVTKENKKDSKCKQLYRKMNQNPKAIKAVKRSARVVSLNAQNKEVIKESQENSKCTERLKKIKSRVVSSIQSKEFIKANHSEMKTCEQTKTNRLRAVKTNSCATSTTNQSEELMKEIQENSKCKEYHSEIRLSEPTISSKAEKTSTPVPSIAIKREENFEEHQENLECEKQHKEMKSCKKPRTRKAAKTSARLPSIRKSKGHYSEIRSCDLSKAEKAFSQIPLVPVSIKCEKVTEEYQENSNCDEWNSEMKSGEQRKASLTGKTSHSVVSTTIPDKELIKENEANRKCKPNSRRAPIDIPPHILLYMKKRPKVNFHKKREHLELVIYLKQQQKPLYKKFKCSEEGKQDSVAISEIETFLTTGLVDWLKSRNIVLKPVVDMTSSIKPKKILPLPGAEELDLHCSERLSSLVSKKPVVRYESKDVSFRLQLCSKNSGKTFNKYFKCSDAGIKDKSAMEKIKEFLSSPEAVAWLHRRDDSIDQLLLDPSGQWQPVQELSVGLDTKSYFDQFKFDIRKRIVVSKGIKSIYPGHLSTLAASVRKNNKWGSTHRFDEHYVLDPDTGASGNIAVQMYITCSSKSPQCRTACGHLISTLNWNDIRSCPGCLHDLSDHLHQCEICMLESCQSNWLFIDGVRHCSACHRYKMQYNKNRPAYLRNFKGRSLNHPHVRCGWRLKLVIYKADLSKWFLFNSTKNDFFHRSPAHQVKKRPSLSIRDEWDKQRVVNNSSAKKILVALGQDSSKKVPFHSTIQINNRLKTIDRHLRTDDQEIEVFPSSIDVVNSEPTITLASENATENASSVPSYSRSHMTCLFCTQEQRPYPFTTKSWEMLGRHWYCVHSYAAVGCPTCYHEFGIEAKFENKASLRKHHKLVHETSAKVKNETSLHEHHKLVHEADVRTEESSEVCLDVDQSYLSREETHVNRVFVIEEVKGGVNDEVLNSLIEDQVKLKTGKRKVINKDSITLENFKKRRSDPTIISTIDNIPEYVQIEIS